MQRADLKRSGRIRSKYKPSDLFTQEEVIEVINACDHPRDKALIVLQYDAALRPHELIKLRISDITFHDKYAQVTVPEDSKTGSRTVPIIFAFPFIREWLNAHPLKNNPESYIFVRYHGTIRSEKSKFPYKPHMGHYNYHQLLLKLKGKLNHKLQKRYWNPYIFRHSGLTNMAKILKTDQKLKTYAGWTPDSPMASIYVHLSGKDINDDILQHHGLVEAKPNEIKPVATIRECPRCNHINSITNRFCDKCSLALTMDAWEDTRNEDRQLKAEVEKLRSDKLDKQEIVSEVVDLILNKVGRFTKVKLAPQEMKEEEIRKWLAELMQKDRDAAKAIIREFKTLTEKDLQMADY